MTVEHKRRDRQALTLADFTEADIAALEAARASEASKDFDHELDTHTDPHRVS
jgi:hypothetical protein